MRLSTCNGKLISYAIDHGWSHCICGLCDRRSHSNSDPFRVQGFNTVDYCAQVVFRHRLWQASCSFRRGRCWVWYPNCEWLELNLVGTVTDLANQSPRISFARMALFSNLSAKSQGNTKSFSELLRRRSKTIRKRKVTAAKSFSSSFPSLVLRSKKSAWINNSLPQLVELVITLIKTKPSVFTSYVIIRYWAAVPSKNCNKNPWKMQKWNAKVPKMKCENAKHVKCASK